MEHLSSYYEIARWIAGEIAGTIGEAEKEKLHHWLKEDEDHIWIYRKIQKRLELGETPVSYRKPESIRNDWEQVKNRLMVRKRRFPFLHPYYRYAALAVILIGIAVGYWKMGRQRTEVVGTEIIAGNTIVPGSAKAMLILADGEKIALDESLQDSICKDGMLIRKKGGEVSYKELAERSDSEQELFNTITIPRGGEYRLVLADGTKVWMNSASMLKYPVKFTGDRRRVYLEGEAYFEVVTDTIHPFVVRTSVVGVKVLGTGFNVRAYPEDGKTEVTLVHGKVAVRSGDDKKVLQPEEQYVWQNAGRKGWIRRVDISHYIAWKDGIMNFDAMPLDELALRLSRWYDVGFHFADESVKDLRFSGAFKKYDEIGYVLSLIEETTEVRFVTEGRRITVLKK